MRCLSVIKLLDINDYYYIDENGNVYSYYHNRKRKISTFHGRNNYLCVSLSKNNTHNTYFVHRLVAQAFIPNPENKPQVNHKDGNKLNNCVENLEWCTASENTKHAYDNKLTHIKRGDESPNAIKIDQFDKNNNFIRTWGGATCVQNKLGLNKSNIIQCCKGRYKTVGGYIWRYHESEVV